jgi:hypothetical protein
MSALDASAYQRLKQVVEDTDNLVRNCRPLIQPYSYAGHIRRRFDGMALSQEF